jgi:hypothetical protein
MITISIWERSLLSHRVPAGASSLAPAPRKILEIWLGGVQAARSGRYLIPPSCPHPSIRKDIVQYARDRCQKRFRLAVRNEEPGRWMVEPGKSLLLRIRHYDSMGSQRGFDMLRLVGIERFPLIELYRELCSGRGAGDLFDFLAP